LKDRILRLEDTCLRRAEQLGRIEEKLVTLFGKTKELNDYSHKLMDGQAKILTTLAKHNQVNKNTVLSKRQQSAFWLAVCGTLGAVSIEVLRLVALLVGGS